MKKEIKGLLMEECKKILNRKLETASGVVAEAQNTANDYGMNKDRYDPFRPQMLRRRDMFAKEVSRIDNDILLVDKIDPDHQFDKVCFGSVIYTKTQKIFVAVSVGKIAINDEVFYGISTEVPIYQVLKDLKKGDEFEFMGKKNKIVDVI